MTYNSIFCTLSTLKKGKKCYKKGAKVAKTGDFGSFSDFSDYRLSTMEPATIKNSSDYSDFQKKS